MNEQEQFIVEWCQNNLCTGVTDSPFHDEFYAKFGGARKQYLWGAAPVHKAMRLMYSMSRRGILARAKVLPGSNGGLGFPNWCYTYHLPGTCD